MSGGWRLYADMGNSALLWAAYGPDGWSHPVRTVPDEQETPRDTGLAMRAMLVLGGYQVSECSGAALLSSNPNMTEHVEVALAELTGHEVALMGRDIHSDLPIDYHDPSQMGQDRIAMVEGARALCGAPVVAITCGTCITAQALSVDGRIVGGAIAPGLAPCHAGLMDIVPHLAEQTAEAARIIQADEAVPPVGHSTVENLAVGLVTTLVGAVTGLATLMRTQVGEDAPLVLTGGSAHMIARHAGERWRVEELLGLEGLRVLHERALGER